MQTLFCRWMVVGLVAGLFCGCSKKVETEEKKAVVEKEVKEVDPAEAIIADKLNRMIIPRMDIEDRTVEEVLDFIRLRVVEIDETESEPTKKGVSMMIRRPKGEPDSQPIDESSDDLLGGGESPDAKRIPELRVRNVSVAAALRYICLMADIRCEVDGRLTISPRDPDAPWNSYGSVLEEQGDTKAIATRLSQIRQPRIDFENKSIHEAIDFLRLKFAEIETERKINFVIHVPKGMETPYIDKLQMTDASFEEVLKEICSKTGMRYELDPYSVILVPKDLK
jgi:hypothetical protein